MIKQTEQKDPFESIGPLINGEIPEKKHLSTGGRVVLEKAPNAVIFIEGERWLDGFKLNYPQFRIVRDYYELLCPACNNVERIMTADDIPRDEQALFEYDVCNSCGYFKYDPEGVDDLHFYNSLTAVIGMRGGKSTLAAGMVASAAHDYLCVENLQDKLGLVKGQILEIGFCASSSEQSSETIYGHFRNFFDRSPWFQNYVKALRNLEISEDGLRRYDLYKGEPGSTSIIFKEKGIYIKSRASNSGSLAGRTRLISAIDELARLDKGESKISAIEVYRAMNRSLLTVRAETERLRMDGDFSIPDASMLCISSPIFSDDLIMKLYAQSEQNQRMLAFRAPTWKFNPKISQTSLAEEFLSDPIGAERDYAANPPGAENPFIRDANLITAAVDKNRKSCFDLREEFFEQKIGEVVFSYVKIVLENIRFNNLASYFLHCDPGHLRDSFAISLLHREEDTVILDGLIEIKPITKGSGLLPREVHFPSATKLILELNKVLDITAVSFDKWSSTEASHQLRDAKILAVQGNVTRDDYIRFLNLLREGKFKFPAAEPEADQHRLDFKSLRNIPIGRALWELKRLNDNGQKVDHSSDSTKDLMDTIVGGVRLIVAPELILNKGNVKKMLEGQKYRGKMYPRKLGNVIKVRR